MSIKYTVLVCTYNGAAYIREQIKSIFFQAVPPEMVIISDDGSVDETKRLCHDEFERLSFTRYTIVDGPGQGPSINFMTAIGRSESDFIFLADQDDIWHSSKISEYISVINEYSDNLPLLIYSDACLIDADGEAIHRSFFKFQRLAPSVLGDDSIIFNNCVQGATICVNRPLADLVSQASLLTGYEDIVMHDWWIAILARYYGDAVFINKPLISYRQHSSNQLGVRSVKRVLLDVVLKPRKQVRNLLMQLRQLEKLLRYMRENPSPKRMLKYDACRLVDILNGMELTSCGVLKKSAAYVLAFMLGGRLNKQKKRLFVET